MRLTMAIGSRPTGGDLSNTSKTKWKKRKVELLDRIGIPSYYSAIEAPDTDRVFERWSINEKSDTSEDLVWDF